MANVWSWLPALACPLLMGVMLLMMRGTADNDRSPAQDVEAPLPNIKRTAPPVRGAYLSKAAWLLSHCINWKVGIGVAIVCLGIWRLVPDMLAVIPLLIAMVCPLSMLLMLRNRRSEQVGAGSMPVTHMVDPTDRTPDIV